MGLQDRTYYRDEDDAPRGSFGGFGGSGGLSVTVRLIIATVVIWVIDSVLVSSVGPGVPKQHLLTEYGALEADWIYRPWEAYRLLTYGFLHAHLEERSGLWHILFNMYLLFMMGRRLEEAVGRRGMLLFYLLGIVAGGLAWSAISLLAGSPGIVRGASAAVSAVVVGTCLRYPRDRVSLFGVIETPLWGFGLMTIALDVFGAIGVGDSNVAYTAHLGGAAWGALHFRWGSRWLDRFDPTSLRKAFRRKPKLQVVRDEYGDEVERDKYELDRILAKLHDQGQSSLTGAERRFLEKQSRLERQRRGK